MDDMGKWLMMAGASLLGLGFFMWAGSSVFGDLRLGRLPGDIHIEREGMSLYIPITTMLLLSLLGSGVMWLFRWWNS
jgi:hypothetical protein